MFLFLFLQQERQVPPRDAENNPLDTIGQQFGLQTPEKQPLYAILPDHFLYRLLIRNLFLTGLLYRLDDPDRV